MAINYKIKEPFFFFLNKRLNIIKKENPETGRLQFGGCIFQPNSVRFLMGQTGQSVGRLVGFSPNMPNPT
jgi:hypothetical protein